MLTPLIGVRPTQKEKRIKELAVREIPIFLVIAAIKF